MCICTVLSMCSRSPGLTPKASRSWSSVERAKPSAVHVARVARSSVEQRSRCGRPRARATVSQHSRRARP